MLHYSSITAVELCTVFGSASLAVRWIPAGDFSAVWTRVVSHYCEPHFEARYGCVVYSLCGTLDYFVGAAFVLRFGPEVRRVLRGLENATDRPGPVSVGCFVLLCRLLNVLVRQVGRASANVQRSNASLGIGSSSGNSPPFPLSPNESPPSPTNAPTRIGGQSARQQQGGGEGTATSPMATPLPKETPLLRRGMRLRRDEPGRAAAHRDMGLQHSMTLWVRKAPCVVKLLEGLGEWSGYIILL